MEIYVSSEAQAGNPSGQVGPEVRPAFTWRYIGLATLIGVLPLILGGVAGYVGNELVRDRKVIEVSSSMSSNLATLPDSVAGNIEVLFALSPSQKESIKSLFRYEVVVANKSELGVEDLLVVIVPPRGVQLVVAPNITTVPQELLSAIAVRQSERQPGMLQFDISLLNSSQAVKFAFFGFSVSEKISEQTKLTAIAQKKDWSQRNVEIVDLKNPTGLADILQKPLSEYRTKDVIVLMLLGIIVMLSLRVYFLVAYAILLIFNPSLRNRQPHGLLELMLLGRLSP
jgi:hypothetical protein